MVAKRLDRLRNIVRSDEEYLTFEEWIAAGTWVNYAVCT
jgi:deoxyhypusine synthase